MTLDDFIERVFRYAKDVELNNIELMQDNGHYYLGNVQYKFKLDGVESELHYPKIQLPISTNHMPYPYEIVESSQTGKPIYAKLGTLALAPNDDGALLICKRHPKKVTLKELEKQLGYPIEIVNEETEEK